MTSNARPTPAGAPSSDPRRAIAADTGRPAPVPASVRVAKDPQGLPGFGPVPVRAGGRDADRDVRGHLGDSPHWGGPENVVAAPRNVGDVPTQDGALVPFVAPNRIEIPAIDATAPIIKVGTLPGRELEIPLNPRVVGWWSSGAKPGARKGTAILAGHINYAGVTGEIAEIGTLDPGDKVYMYGKRTGQGRHGWSS